MNTWSGARVGERLPIEMTDGGAAFDVKVVPGGSRDRIVGLLDGALKVKVSAPAEGGKANKAVCALLAGALGVAKRDVRVISGHGRPRKRVAVFGADAEAVRKLAAPPRRRRG